MKLYVYDHCPYCVKARMIFGLKKVPFELKILLNDDEETPVKMVGKKVVPILQKNSGNYMPESLDIVAYIDKNFGGEAVLIGTRSDIISSIINDLQQIDYTLLYPRFIKIGLAEFATQSAIDYFVNKKSKKSGSFDECLQKTDQVIKHVERLFAKLENVLQSAQACNGTLSIDDICLFPLLRNLSCVKALNFPPKVDAYTKTMAAQSNVNLYFNNAL